MRRPSFPHTWHDFPRSEPEDVPARLAGATIAILNRTAIGASDLEAAPLLRLIAVAATGVDSVDLAACRVRGIAVTNVRDWSTTTVAEHLFGLLLAIRRGLIATHLAVREGAWQRSRHHVVMPDTLPRRLEGSTCGIIGYGSIGRAMETRARGFGMDVIVADRKGDAVVRAGRVPFDEVLSQADVLAICTPLTEETRGLIGSRELGRLRRHCVVLNASRGGVLDESALAAALHAGAIAGAGVDVLEHEPPADGNPLLSLDHPGLIVTPHVAWLSEESLADLREEVMRNIEAFVGGVDRNRVV